MLLNAQNFSFWTFIALYSVWEIHLNNIWKILFFYAFIPVGGGSLSKQRLPHQGNITAVVFPKWLKLSVISHAHSALTSFEIKLAYGSLLKSQKSCQSFAETLLRFQCLFRLLFEASSGAISMILTGLLCFFLLLSSVHIFILEFFITARL